MGPHGHGCLCVGPNCHRETTTKRNVMYFIPLEGALWKAQPDYSNYVWGGGGSVRQ